MEPVVRYLLDRGKISRGQLNEARRTQQFFGGQLASHLLKLGFVDEGVLGEALTEVTGVPFASFETLRAVPAEVQDRISPRLLEIHRACPIDESDGRLRMAMLNPRDALAIRELEKAAALPIEPWVTTEYRLYQALERHFRVRLEGLPSLSLAPPAEMRRWRLGQRAAVSVAVEAPAEVPSAERGSEEVGLDGLPLDAEPDEVKLWGGTADPLAVDLPQDDLAEPSTRPADGAAPSLDDRLSDAEDRESIARSIVDYCRGMASRVLLFAAGKNDIHGVAGSGEGFADDRVRALRLERGSSTLLESVLDGGKPYFGALPADAGSRDLFGMMRVPSPPTVAVYPIGVRGRVVALLHLDNGPAPLLPPDPETMRRLTAKAGLAFEILLLRGKLRSL